MSKIFTNSWDSIAKLRVFYYTNDTLDDEVVEMDRKSRRSLAEKIAAIYDTTPVRIMVPMIGAEDVAALLQVVECAHNRAHEKPLQLD